MYDYDVIGSNDLAGLCVVACKDVPRLSGGTASLTDPNATERKNLTLPLFHASETLALQELDDRHQLDDKEAAAFWKTYKKLLETTKFGRHRRAFGSLGFSSGVEKQGGRKASLK